MNEAEILQILKNNGAPATPENMQRVMQQSGRGTELLGRSMGLQGGMDESGPGMDLMLDKLVKNTSTPTQMPIVPNSESDGNAQNGAAPAGRVEVGTPKVVARAPTQGRGIAPNTEPPPGTMPSTNTAAAPTNNTMGMQLVTLPNGQQVYQPKEGINGVVGQKDSEDISGLGWLAALLGLSAAAKPGAPPATEMLRLPAPNKQIGYEPKLTDESGPKMPSGAPEMTNKDVQKTKGMAQTPEDIARLKAEVEAENAALNREMPAEVGKSAKPKKSGADETIEAVKRFRKMFAK